MKFSRLFFASMMLSIITAATAFAQTAPQLPKGMTGSNPNDPRSTLTPGLYDAGIAAKGIKHLQLFQNPAAFQLGATSPDDPKVDSTLGMLGIPGRFVPKEQKLVTAGLAFANSDLAFQGNRVFMGNFYGVNIFDVSDGSKAKLLTSMICPGGQGDVSVYKNLMFMSVEMTNGRLDCGAQGFPVEMPTMDGPSASKERFRGVRIFDISDIKNPKQIAAVQSCRGSHTHTLLVDPKDKANIYVYISGTSSVRKSEELEGCSGQGPDKDPNTSLFRIEVIKVPLAAPQTAKIVSSPRIFADDATGKIAGLTNGGSHESSRPAETDQCHDITVYPEIGLAAGACAGNGILLDIRDPANPKRIEAVNDKNYAYWHSASFSNDGSKVVYTDEWGGGMGARCRATDPNIWGANAIFNLKDGKLSFGNYYKMPAAQGDSENCVAHNGSLIPVPGRDIKVQAWYQGGISVMDFTDPKAPREIAYFDRGPVDAKTLILGGYWSVYWYNGRIYGSEINRGLDILELTPTAELSQNEIDAAKAVVLTELNVQHQQKTVWPNKLIVAKAYNDQLERSKALSADMVATLRGDITAAETSGLSKAASGKLKAHAATLSKMSGMGAADSARVAGLAAVLTNPVK